jgi:aspartyl-tRNA(Asn)/glutamyl-tRNA(Gln) amidotransferase subunit A
MDVLSMSFLEVAKLYRSKEISPVEVIRLVFERYQQAEPSLCAFITMLEKEAFEMANVIEKRLMTGEQLSILAGIPFSAKDLYDTNGVRTTCGSNVLKDHVPKRTAAVVERFTEAGAVLIGKNNMLEFAYGIAHPDYKQTNNPWDITKTAGGSSGGSAAAVMAGIGYFSLGSDTGGSIRIPASYCGVVGLKPTYGKMSLDGVFPLSWSLDHAGPLAKTVREVATLMNISGADDERVLPFSKKIAILPDSYLGSLTTDVRKVYDETMKLVKELADSVATVEIPNWYASEKDVMDLVLPEATSIHQQWFHRKEDYAPGTYQQLQAGKVHQTLDYLRALKNQANWRQSISLLFEGIDFLVMPTVAFVAPAEDPVIGDAELNEMTFTGPFNLSGHPAITLNMGFSESGGLPVGMQIVGGWNQENKLLAFAEALENRARVDRKWSVGVVRQSL